MPETHQQQKIRIGVAGGAGYTGGELLRLLLLHPFAEIVFVHSRSQAGLPLHHTHRDLLGETELCFSAALSPDIDVLFLCVGHGEARVFLEEHRPSPAVKIIDLSQDFRLKNTAEWRGRSFVYGLPEHNRAQIQQATAIANPGCFATAIQLALLPLAQAGLLQDEVQMTGITGATGAGQKLQASSHFSWRVNNIQAYKPLSHQHMNEIRETLGSLQDRLPRLNFIPWRGDFSRGIYLTAYTACNAGADRVNDLYRAAYRDHQFTHVSDATIDLKQVVNTNKCLLHIEEEDGRIIIHAAIDNLLKGASGQAVQNMNLLFGLPEDTGLRLKSISF